MIKKNQTYLNLLHVAIDAIVIYLSFVISFFLRFKFEPVSSLFVKAYYRELWQYNGMLAVFVPAYLLLYAYFGLYKPKRYQHTSRELTALIRANTCGLLFIFIYIFFWKIEHIPRSLLIFFYVVSMVMSIFVRGCIRLILRKGRAHGHNLKHVIVIGESAASRAYIDRIKANPHWGYMIHGIFADNVSSGYEYKGIPFIGKIQNLQKYLQANQLDEVAIALSLREYHKLEAIVDVSGKCGATTVMQVLIRA